MKMKKKGGGGGSNWMDTYGDMVTLLLCFFVLLYSMSTLDQQKWEQVVQSFNPDAIPTQTEMKGNEGQSADPVTNPEDVDKVMQKLAEMLESYVKQQGAAENVSVTKGDGYVFISFNDAVFFDGDSHIIRPDGKEVLTAVGEILAQARDSIDEVRVLGHTAQATADTPNPIVFDRMLASNRAAMVVAFFQEMDVVDPARLVSVGYGQWRPVDSNETREERAHNRRVEMIISGIDLTTEGQMTDSITTYYTERGTENPNITENPVVANSTQTGAVNNDGDDGAD